MELLGLFDSSQVRMWDYHADSKFFFFFFYFFILFFIFYFFLFYFIFFFFLFFFFFTYFFTYFLVLFFIVSSFCIFYQFIHFFFHLFSLKPPLSLHSKRIKLLDDMESFLSNHQILNGQKILFEEKDQEKAEVIWTSSEKMDSLFSWFSWNLLRDIGFFFSFFFFSFFFFFFFSSFFLLFSFFYFFFLFSFSFIFSILSLSSFYSPSLFF